MKVLHTSDWHLGHVLYDFDRTEEQVFMMEQMEQMVVDLQPDAFLISGDVFNTSAPSASIQHKFADSILRMHIAKPDMNIIVTAGNHDSQSRHEIFRSLWETANVQMIGTLDIEHPENHIVKVGEKGFVVAVPYANERFMPTDFFSHLEQYVAERNSFNLPVILMAHTTVAGCDISGHQGANELTVGGIDSVGIDCFGSYFDYLALGHIHKPQNISAKARYCGTPMSVSFDEQFEHSVTLVNLERHGDLPILATLPVEEMRPLVTLPAHDPLPFEEACQLLHDFPDHERVYIRLNVKVEDFLPPNANVYAEDAARGKDVRFCYISVQRNPHTTRESGGMTVSELQTINPMDLARKYTTDKGLPFDEELFKSCEP